MDEMVFVYVLLGGALLFAFVATVSTVLLKDRVENLAREIALNEKWQSKANEMFQEQIASHASAFEELGLTYKPAKTTRGAWVKAAE